MVRSPWNKTIEAISLNVVVVVLTLEVSNLSWKLICCGQNISSQWELKMSVMFLVLLRCVSIVHQQQMNIVYNINLQRNELFWIATRYMTSQETIERPHYKRSSNIQSMYRDLWHSSVWRKHRQIPSLSKFKLFLG